MSELKLISLNKGIYRTSFGNDGELEECVNLIPENGQLKPVQNPKAIEGVVMQQTTIGEEEYTDKLMYVHENGTFTHYIAEMYAEVDDPEQPIEYYLTYYDEAGVRHDTSFRWQIDPGVTINQITHVGNTLIVLTSEGIERFLWKDGTYMALGNDLPELDIQFGLEGSLVSRFASDQLTMVKSTSSKDKSYNGEPIEYTEDSGGTTIRTPQYKDAEVFYEFERNIIAGETYQWTFVPVKNNCRYSIDIFMLEAYPTNPFNLHGAVKKLKHGAGTREATYTVPTGDDYEGFAIKIHVENGGDSLLCPMTVVLRSTERESTEVVSDYRLENTPDNINAVMGEANEFVKEEGMDQNLFIYPFMVRYAFQLYDGTYTKPSSPCLMIPNSGSVPLMRVLNRPSGGAESGMVSVMTEAVTAKLMYKVRNAASFTNWDDIIKKVVIAVSEPMYSYDQGNTWEEGKVKIKTDANAIGAYSSRYFYGGIENTFGKYSLYDLKAEGAKPTVNDYNIVLPELEGEKKRTPQNAGIFRIISEIDIADLANLPMSAYKDVKMESGTLSAWNGMALLSDNSASLNQPVAKVAFPYNHRLNIADYVEKKWRGHDAGLMNGDIGLEIEQEQVRLEKYAAVITLSENGETKTVSRNLGHAAGTPMLWFYYPGLTATRATLYKKVYFEGFTTGTYYKAELPLKEHETLNGCCWFGDWEEVIWETVTDEDEETAIDNIANAEAGYSYPNRIMQTKVDNPFAWEEKVSSVASDKILAICAVTKPLSQNMFGQNPLVAFTNDGIWGLTVNADGTYGAPQSINRDIVTNTKCIIQTDEAIIYATGQGLKITTGQVGEGKELCPQMRGVQRLSLSDVVGDTEVTSQPWGSRATGALSVTRTFNTFMPTDDRLFVDMLRTCNGCYDYAHKLIHLYPTEDMEPYIHWAVSTETGEVISVVMDYITTHPVTHMHRFQKYDKPMAVVNGYPSSYIQQGYEIMMYDQEYASYNENNIMKVGMLLTRPIAFGDATAMKVLEDMRSMMEKSTWTYVNPPANPTYTSRARAIVMVSNDGVEWFRLKSLRSRSWKWYRIALFTEMTDKDTLQGVVCKVSERRTNKIR